MTRVLMFFALTLSLAGTASLVRSESDLLGQVATCTGRLSAYLERVWAEDLPNAADVSMVHGHMTDLMFALVNTERDDRASRDQRTKAKLSFRALLERAPADYSSPRAVRMAAMKIETDLRSCAALVLPHEAIDAALGLEDGLHLSQLRTGTDHRTAEMTASK